METYKEKQEFKKRLLLRVLKHKNVNEKYYHKLLEGDINYRVIDSRITWSVTEEGYNFWLFLQLDFSSLLCYHFKNKDEIKYYKDIFSDRITPSIYNSVSKYKHEYERHRKILNELLKL